LKEALKNIRLTLSDRSVNMVILMAFMSIFGLGLVAPTLPLFAKSFGVGYAGAGILISGFGLSRLIFDLVAGPIIDRVGERKSSSGALLFMGVGALVTGSASVYGVAVAAWALNGAGSAVLFAAQYSYLLKVVPKERMARTLSVFYGAFNLGFISGSFIGGLLSDQVGLATPLLVYGPVLFVLAFLYPRLVKDPKERAKPATQEEADEEAATDGIGIRSLFKLPGFVTVIFLNLAYLWMVAAVFETLVPLFASDGLGMSRSGVGLVFALTIATEFVVLYPAGSLADRLGRRPVLIPSVLALGVMTVLVGAAPTPLVFALLMGLLGITSGFAGVPPAAMLSDVVPESRLGTGVGVFRFCGDLGFFLGPLIAGFTSKAYGFQTAFAIVAVPSFIALVFLLRTAETLRRPTDPDRPPEGELSAT
jgi:MFS family permease